jgi:hypothetical protein
VGSGLLVDLDYSFEFRSRSPSGMTDREAWADEVGRFVTPTLAGETSARRGWGTPVGLV